MIKNNFFEELSSVLQTSENIDDETLLNDIEEWDSLGIISVVSFLDEKYKIKTNYSDLSKCMYVKDIRKKVFPND